MRKWIIALATPLVLASQPAIAEDDAEAKQAEVMAVLAEAFKVEPLNAEQAARLPLATALIDQIVPDGTMDEMMGSMFDGMLGPVMKLAEEAGPSLSDFIGYGDDDLELEDEAVAEIAAIVDPRWQERQRRTMEVTQSMMAKLMAAMEPEMKRGMAEAYAVNFTRVELDGIRAFFSTEIGANYARKSYKLASDPRIMGAAMREFPAMMAVFKDMGEQLKAEMADLPAKKDFEALSAAERRRLIDLTGLTAEQLREGMAMVAEQDTAHPAF